MTESKQLRRYGWRAAAFASSFLITGLSLWPQAYAQVSIPNSLFGIGLLFIVLCAVIARTRGRLKFWPATWLIAAAVPAAILARVCVEVTRDPTSHNLWPFEIVMGMGLGLLCSAPGALIGGWLDAYFDFEEKP